MRFKRYINEGRNIGDNMIVPNELMEVYQPFIDDIFKNCKPFLKDWIPLYRHSKDFLYRGMDYYNNAEYGKKKVRKNRIPSSTPLYDHDVFDEAFKKKFGWSARSNSIFCTFEESTADAYGDVYVVFPIGRYKALWSEEINDLTVDISSVFGYRYKLDKVYKNHPDRFKEETERNMNILDKVLNTYEVNNLRDASMTANEVMIKCKEYYYIYTKSPMFDVFVNVLKTKI
jgi:hypothetical protein